MRFVNKEKKKQKTHTIPASSLLAVNITISYHLATVKQASSQIKGLKKKKKKALLNWLMTIHNIWKVHVKVFPDFNEI